ncbi:hypothetical protein F5051DRAFT_94931 [Lentinula edodes]|nr:hypothetical protein F5051DRAFT_94931 [Lentinula edodes]
MCVSSSTHVMLTVSFFLLGMLSNTLFHRILLFIQSISYVAYICFFILFVVPFERCGCLAEMNSGTIILDDHIC